MANLTLRGSGCTPDPAWLEHPLIAPFEKTKFILALRAVCGDVGCDWLSSTGQDRETDLTEVCGGSGWYGRPTRPRPTSPPLAKWPGEARG
jgi:hypothetical protein